MPPPVLVKVAAAGVNVLPVLVRYGWSVRTTFWLTTVEVAVMSSRCLPRRYCAAVTARTSGRGWTVTVVNSGSEATPAVFVAVMVRLMTTGVTVPSTRVGAVAVIVAEVGPVDFAGEVRLSRAGAPVWLTEKVRDCALGSVPLTGMLMAPPENTRMGATWLTVGWGVALTLIVALEVAEPQRLVAESVAVTVDAGVNPRAEKTALPTPFVVKVPLEAVQSRVTGAVPVVLP